MTTGNTTGNQSSEPHRVTSLAVGTVTLAWNRLRPRRSGRWRDVAVGTVFDAEDVVAQLVTAARQRTAGAVHRARTRVDALAERGAHEAGLGEQRAAEAVGALLTAIATSPPADRLIDAQLDRTVRPLMVKVLDDVLALLEAEPQRLRSVVRGQRDNLLDELVNRLRSGTAAGDEAVDRLTGQVRRSPAAVGLGPPGAPPP